MTRQRSRSAGVLGLVHQPINFVRQTAGLEDGCFRREHLAVRCGERRSKSFEILFTVVPHYNAALVEEVDQPSVKE